MSTEISLPTLPPTAAAAAAATTTTTTAAAASPSTVTNHPTNTTTTTTPTLPLESSTPDPSHLADAYDNVISRPTTPSSSNSNKVQELERLSQPSIGMAITNRLRLPVDGTPEQSLSQPAAAAAVVLPHTFAIDRPEQLLRSHNATPAVTSPPVPDTTANTTAETRTTPQATTVADAHVSTESRRLMTPFETQDRPERAQPTSTPRGHFSRFQWFSRHPSPTTTNSRSALSEGTTIVEQRQRYLGVVPRTPKIQSYLVTCLASGIMLVTVLAVYLGLQLTRESTSSQFTILLILILVLASAIFCHGVMRVCVLSLRPQSVNSSDHRPPMAMSHFQVPGGYAVPSAPIRVTLARDEEAAGIESETTHLKPPAYGEWRGSVRVDPNRIFWERATSPDRAASSHTSTHDAGEPVDHVNAPASAARSTDTPRPPSYISEDGVEYVIDARPRSIAPPVMHETHELPLHPSERNGVGQPAPW